MIRILKGEAPSKLVNSGLKKTKKDLEEYNKHVAEYNSGAKTIEADNAIYNSDEVREALEGIQKNKCCYCETKSTRSNSDIEHYRPKKAYSKSYGGVSFYPGYFWLAYDWDNLFLACQVCNQIFKNDFFPIEDEKHRAQNNSFSIANEECHIVHPSIDIPENEIEYVESYPKGKTKKGKLSIAYLGFGSIEHGKEVGIEYSDKHKIRIRRLVEERDKYYHIMKDIYDAIKILEKKNLDLHETQVLNNLKDKLNKAQQKDAVWSSMIKCAVKNDFKNIV